MFALAMILFITTALLAIISIESVASYGNYDYISADNFVDTYKFEDNIENEISSRTSNYDGRNETSSDDPFEIPTVPDNLTVEDDICTNLVDALSLGAYEEALITLSRLEDLPAGYFDLFTSAATTAIVASRKLFDIKKYYCGDRRNLLVTENCDDNLPSVTAVKDGLIAAKAYKIVSTVALLALPECGGVSGDACALGVSAAKVALGIVKSAADSTVLGLNSELESLNNQYSKCHRDISAANHDNIIETLQKVDSLICPYGNDGLQFSLLGQGCDGIDNNCDAWPNAEVDECEEDQVPPEIKLNSNLPSTPFQSNDEARKFLEENISTSDDCVPSNLLQISQPVLVDTNGKERTFRVTVIDPRCIAERTAASTNTQDFIATVDSAGPLVTCGFFKQQHENYVMDENFIPGVMAPPYPDEALNDILHVDYRRDTIPLLDVKLWYHIEDNTDSIIDVTVTVRSNELEYEERKMNVIFEENYLPNLVHRARVYLAPFTCKDNSRASMICDDEEDISTRYYDIEIAAKDPTGNIGKKICSVAVVPYKHSSGKGKGQGQGKGKGYSPQHDKNAFRIEHSESVQRFKIGIHQHEWDPFLDTDLEVPPLPSPPAGKGKGKGKRNNGNTNDDETIERAKGSTIGVKGRKIRGHY